jgi:hypothetical protein
MDEIDIELRNILRGFSVLLFIFIFSPITLPVAIILGLEDIYKFIRGE